MLPLADLFVYLYVWIDDALKNRQVIVPDRPGPAPVCSDAEVLTITLARHARGVTSENGWLAEVRADWGHYFPHLPAQSEFNRRTRWLVGAFELLHLWLISRLPEDGWQQIDTTALPVKHPSAVRGPDGWTTPAGFAADFGFDAAHHEWFYGFRLGLRTDLGSRLVRAWEILPAAVNERDAADDLLDPLQPPAGLLLDRGFTSRAWAATQADRGTTVVLAPSRAQRRTMTEAQRRPVAAFRNRIE